MPCPVTPTLPRLLSTTLTRVTCGPAEHHQHPPKGYRNGRRQPRTIDGGKPHNWAVAHRSHWGLTPRQSIEAECARRGRREVIAGCVRLVLSQDVDVALILALGGPPAHRVIDADADSDLRYWLRVWGTRGLLWAWDASATNALRGAVNDPAWRVREMAAKVVARHLVGDLLPAVAELRNDPIPRVRAAGSRAVAILTHAGA